MNRSENFVVAFSVLEGRRVILCSCRVVPAVMLQNPELSPLKGLFPSSHGRASRFFSLLCFLPRSDSTRCSQALAYSRGKHRRCFFHREVNFGILLEFRIPCFFASQQPFVNSQILYDLMPKMAWNEFIAK